MTLQAIGLGTIPNDKTGDPLLVGGEKINHNFYELYSYHSNSIFAGSPDFVGTKEARINAAITAAIALGKLKVVVPKYAWDGLSMLPYNANLVTFNPTILMLREEGTIRGYDLRAYGAAGDGVTDDYASIVGALNGAGVPNGNIIICTPGTYVFNTPLVITNPVIFEGAGCQSTILSYNSTTGVAMTWQFASNLRSGFGLRDLTLNGVGFASGQTPTGIQWGSGGGLSVAGALIANCLIQNFNLAMTWGTAQAFAIRVIDSVLSNNAQDITIGYTVENVLFVHTVFGHSQGSYVANAIQVGGGGTNPDITFDNCSFDNAQLKVNSGQVSVVGGHFEDPGVTTTDPYIWCVGGSVCCLGVVFAQDSLTSTVPSSFILINSAGQYTGYGNAYVNSSSTTFPIIQAQNTGNVFDFGARIMQNVIAPTNSSTGACIFMGYPIGGASIFTGAPIASTPTVLTDASPIAINAAFSNVFSVTLNVVGATRAMGLPANPTPGQRITITIIQDGSGSRALTWNAVFKVSWSDTGNGASKRSTISFIYDGTNWNQDGAQTPYV